MLVLPFALTATLAFGTRLPAPHPSAADTTPSVVPAAPAPLTAADSARVAALCRAAATDADQAADRMPRVMPDSADLRALRMPRHAPDVSAYRMPTAGMSVLRRKSGGPAVQLPSGRVVDCPPAR